MDNTRHYSFYSPDLYEPSAENVGCGIMSWGRDWVQTYYPHPRMPTPEMMTARTQTEYLKYPNPRFAQIRSTAVGAAGKPPTLRPTGWLFSPLEIQNWTWPEN